MGFWNREKIAYEKLNQMLDEAMEGSFQEENYTEDELSKLESKWVRFLSSSSLSDRQLKEEKAKIQELITDISHQTKTPLSGILLYTQLLQEEKLPASAVPLVQEIARQAQKLEFLIQALLKTSRLETGVFQLSPSRQLLFPLLSQAREELASKAALKEIEILLPSFHEEAACFDLKWTKEALCNLLDNSIKYSPEGSRITLSLRPFEMFCAVDVTDEGPGIPQDELPKLFGRFCREETSGETEGVGIGLYLSREILSRQGGYLTASSSPGAGSTFSMFLPR